MSHGDVVVEGFKVNAVPVDDADDVPIVVGDISIDLDIPLNFNNHLLEILKNESEFNTLSNSPMYGNPIQWSKTMTMTHGPDQKLIVSKHAFLEGAGVWAAPPDTEADDFDEWQRLGSVSMDHKAEVSRDHNLLRNESIVSTVVLHMADLRFHDILTMQQHVALMFRWHEKCYVMTDVRLSASRTGDEPGYKMVVWVDGDPDVTDVVNSLVHYEVRKRNRAQIMRYGAPVKYSPGEDPWRIISSVV